MADFTLYIGNKNYSSWSLRGWLMLKATGVAFEEVLIRLSEPNTRTEVLRYSPSGRVPALKHGEVLVWDTLAIGEYLAEHFPQAKLWPEDTVARALARSVSAEMHSGFPALRNHFPMNIRSSFPNRPITPEVQPDIDRITAIWHECRTRFGAEGPFLFGPFTIADAMYAPVVSRFRTYKIEVDAEVSAYCDAIWASPALQEWLAAARNEPWVIEDSEF
ncbi:MAG TPA: glutathione S-transferase family protein [Stellaceae bacterium]|nr:glutathione S-transferase family protein [Stellaceae bacterium]